MKSSWYPHDYVATLVPIPINSYTGLHATMMPLSIFGILMVPVYSLSFPCLKWLVGTILGCENPIHDLSVSRDAEYYDEVMMSVPKVLIPYLNKHSIRFDYTGNVVHSGPWVVLDGVEGPHNHQYHWMSPAILVWGVHSYDTVLRAIVVRHLGFAVDIPDDVLVLCRLTGDDE